jgi:organic radical activating enzyme
MNIKRDKSEKEHKFTSTGIKFWKHRYQMDNYRNGDPNTIISTHISPEGSCNLNCHYCSVKKRDSSYRIEMPVIKDYITKLKSRGLKAVIITGGGEPTLYKHFNELVTWLSEQDLKIGLITNGTLTDRVDVWDKFSWIRVSINIFDDYENLISLPIEKIPSDVVVGSSFIETNNLVDNIEGIKRVVDKIQAKYVRILPNCLLNHEDLLDYHEKIDKLIDECDLDERFFHQYKVHETPNACICHQSYFRPYLSEVDGGTVYPCDSLVLNDNNELFHRKFQLCKAEDILEYLNGSIEQKFSPDKDCSGCVFNDNITMLDNWKHNGISKFEEFEGTKMNHEEFV